MKRRNGLGRQIHLRLQGALSDVLQTAHISQGQVAAATMVDAPFFQYVGKTGISPDRLRCGERCSSGWLHVFVAHRLFLVQGHLPVVCAATTS